MNNIFVYIELENGAVADVSLELLTKGRELADTLKVKLEAVAIGERLAGLEKELARYGADTVWVADEIGRASVGKECRSRWSPYH